MGELATVAPAPAPAPAPQPGPSSFVVNVPPSLSPHGARGLRKPPVALGSVISIVTYLSSFPLLGYGVWLLATRDFNCEDLLPYSPQVNYRATFGVALLLIFAASCFFTYNGAKILHPGAVALACLLIVMLILGIVFLGSFPMESRGVPFSPMWVRTRIAAEGGTWAEVRACIYKSRACQDMAFRTIQLSPEDFSNQKLSLIESGCCKPPGLCGMEYVNATYWNRPRENPPPNGTYPGGGGGGGGSSTSTYVLPLVSTNSSVNPKTFGDCLAYSNVDTQLCYECQSCKEGFVKSVHAHWKKLGEFFISMSVILLTVHSVRFVVTMITRE